MLISQEPLVVGYNTIAILYICVFLMVTELSDAIDSVSLKPHQSGAYGIFNSKIINGLLNNLDAKNDWGDELHKFVFEKDMTCIIKWNTWTR